MTVTIDREPSPVVLSRTIDRLEAGQARTLLFKGPRRTGLAHVTTMVVEAEPVHGLRTLAAYPLTFGAAYRPPGRAVATGLHGTGLQAVKALPGNRPLSPRRVTTVVAPAGPAFSVRVKDTGDSPETRVRVTLTIRQSPSPVVVTKTIPLLRTGRQATVLFRNLGQVVYSTRVTVKVDVEPVPGEKNLANNSASYPVVFSLG